MNLSRWPLVAALALTLAASPAYAVDHLARVNEVMLSNAGDPTQQFLEIEDPTGETFPSSYSIFVYGADGTTIAHNQGIVFPSGSTMRVTLITGSARQAFGAIPINSNPPNVVINLGGTLPAVGTACFRKAGVEQHCLSWGNAAAPSMVPVNGRVTGAAPTDGTSLQRQPTCAAVGAPTPNAANASITCPPPMADAGVDAPGGGGGGGGDDGCSAAHGAGGFGLVALVSVLAIGRRGRRRGR
ncbi:MAG: hypothetical protein IPQ07_02165 [Myxococcales bacterium]|nr:hypothetical protein [Myxococcales bacterium]